MKIRNKNLTTLGDKFSGKMHDAFRRSSINKFYSNIEVDRMITYNEILGEFIDIGRKDLYDEFERGIIDGENPNILLESILKRNENKPTLGYLLSIIEYYIDIDIIKMFS